MTTRGLSTGMSIALALAGLGCGDRAASSTASKDTSSGLATPVAPTVEVTVAITIDGKPAATVVASRLGGRPTVTEVLDQGRLTPDGVRAIVVHGRGGALLSTESSLYPGAQPRLYLDELHRPSFGWFRLPPENASPELEAALNRPAMGLADIASVDLVTMAVAPVPTAVEVSEASIQVVIGDRHHVLTKEQLRKLPIHRKAGTGGRFRGWRVIDVIASVTGNATIATVDVIAADQHVSFTRAQLVDAKDPLILKVNNRGAFNLRSVGGTSIPGVQRLEVTTR